MDIYADMQQALSDELSQNSEQGEIYYVQDGAPTGDVYNPTPGAPVKTLLSAAASGVSEKYLTDTRISARDIQVIAAVFAVSPTNSGRIEIDGREHQIIRIDKIPAAGTAVAYRFFVKS